MSEKILVPEGMLAWVIRARYGTANEALTEQIRRDLEAALRWLSENPIVPSDEQMEDMEIALDKSLDGHKQGVWDGRREQIAEWERRMFLASPEPCDNPVVQRVVQQCQGITLSRDEADYIIDQVNMVTHG